MVVLELTTLTMGPTRFTAVGVYYLMKGVSGDLSLLFSDVSRLYIQASLTLSPGL